MGQKSKSILCIIGRWAASVLYSLDPLVLFCSRIVQGSKSIPVWGTHQHTKQVSLTIACLFVFCLCLNFLHLFIFCLLVLSLRTSSGARLNRTPKWHICSFSCESVIFAGKFVDKHVLPSWRPLAKLWCLRATFSKFGPRSPDHGRWNDRRICWMKPTLSGKNADKHKLPGFHINLTLNVWTWLLVANINAYHAWNCEFVVVGDYKRNIAIGEMSRAIEQFHFFGWTWNFLIEFFSIN